MHFNLILTQLHLHKCRPLKYKKRWPETGDDKDACKKGCERNSSFKIRKSHFYRNCIFIGNSGSRFTAIRYPTFTRLAKLCGLFNNSWFTQNCSVNSLPERRPAEPVCPSQTLFTKGNLRATL